MKNKNEAINIPDTRNANITDTSDTHDSFLICLFSYQALRLMRVSIKSDSRYNLDPDVHSFGETLLKTLESQPCVVTFIPF